MNYAPDEWVELCAEVERREGALLPDKCLGRLVSFTVPNSDRTSKAKTCYCKMQSMFVTVYEPSDNKKEAKEMRERGAGFARVCGVCDSVGAWPIFSHVLDPTEES